MIGRFLWYLIPLSVACYVVMLVFSLISIALSLVTIGLVFLIIALGAAVLAAVGVVMFRRSQS